MILAQGDEDEAADALANWQRLTGANVANPKEVPHVLD
jgi:hypothetical protein